MILYANMLLNKVLKEILDTIKSKPIQDDHLYAGSVLVSIKDIHIVKKYIWKDNDFIPAMSRLLKHKIIDNKNKMFRDIVACIIQGTILGGTPAVFFETIAMSDIIEIYTGIFTNRSEVLFKQSYEKIILSLLIMCQNHDSCLHKCKQLDTAKSLEQFSQWELLEDEIKEKAQVASQCIQHMSNQDQLPDYKKVVLNKFSDHMHAKNKTYKRMETVVCSYSDCSKIQPVTKEGRFKKCGRCRVVLYCSKECQKAHWINSHSKVCVAPADVK